MFSVKEEASMFWSSRSCRNCAARARPDGKASSHLERRLLQRRGALFGRHAARPVASGFRELEPDYTGDGHLPAVPGQGGTGDIYGAWSFRDTPGWLRVRYFTKRQDGRFEIQPRIRRMVRCPNTKPQYKVLTFVKRCDYNSFKLEPLSNCFSAVGVTKLL